jgi:anti-anti-sigma factor
MDIIQVEKNGIVCVTVKGRMEAGRAQQFEKAIQEIIAEDRRRLLFDLSALEYLRSSVLRVILNAIKEINQKSGRVVLCCLNGYVKEIFEVNRFKNTITITDSVESGLRELSRPHRSYLNNASNAQGLCCPGKTGLHIYFYED